MMKMPRRTSENQHVISCAALVALMDGERFLFQVKHLHTLGVASLQCPAKVNKRTVLLVESVLTTHSEKLAGRKD